MLRGKLWKVQGEVALWEGGSWWLGGDWRADMSLAVCVGVAILQRSIRLYAPFYSSDILIASPLGLRTIIGGEGEKKRDFDFLSSIELLIIDQADIYLMQNWEHVLVMLVIHI